MAGQAGMTIVGVEEVERALRALPGKVAKQAIRKPLRAGAKIVLARAKQNVPAESGALKKSLKVRAGKRSRNTISIRVATGKGWFTGETFYGAFVEFGTAKMKARHYVQRAYAQTKDKVAAFLKREILSNIEALVRASKTK